jgi:LmbE family N-acetylglucosaminyl deacetylase
MDRVEVANGKSPRMLCVFAHPDDEVFCAGGTLAKWAAAGGAAMVMSATRGEAGQIRDGSAATRPTLGSVRAEELRASCDHLGVRHVECLDYQDGSLEGVDMAVLTDEIATRVEVFHPDVVVTFGPDGGYGHPDHLAISTATTQACRQVARAGDHSPLLYYSVFPRRRRLLSHRLARWLTSRRPHFRASGEFVRALALLAEEATLLGYAADPAEVRWFPPGVSIAEQGAAGSGLFLILSGHASVLSTASTAEQGPTMRLARGHFFGAEEIDTRGVYTASLVAETAVTCLVFSTRPIASFDEVGAGQVREEAAMAIDRGGATVPHELVRVDVSPWLDRKMAALGSHRTQFAFVPGLLPSCLLDEWLGEEYFVPVSLPSARHRSLPRHLESVVASGSTSVTAMHA